MRDLLKRFGITKRTRHEAHVKAEQNAPTMRERVLNDMTAHGPCTADAIARRLGLSILSVRPAVTRLAKAGLIEPTGNSGLTDLGNEAAMWRIAA